MVIENKKQDAQVFVSILAEQETHAIKHALLIQLVVRTQLAQVPAAVRKKDSKHAVHTKET